MTNKEKFGIINMVFHIKNIVTFTDSLMFIKDATFKLFRTKETGKLTKEVEMTSIGTSLKLRSYTDGLWYGDFVNRKDRYRSAHNPLFLRADHKSRHRVCSVGPVVPSSIWSNPVLSVLITPETSSYSHKTGRRVGDSSIWKRD